MKGKCFLLFSLICLALLFGTVNTSKATCSMWGKVVYSSQSSSSFSVVVTPSTTYYPSAYYVFTVSPSTLGNVALINKLNTAQATNQKIFILGNATACGTSGIPRPGGTVTAVQVSSIY